MRCCARSASSRMPQVRKPARRRNRRNAVPGRKRGRQGMAKDSGPASAIDVAAPEAPRRAIRSATQLRIRIAKGTGRPLRREVPRRTAILSTIRRSRAIRIRSHGIPICSHGIRIRSHTESGTRAISNAPDLADIALRKVKASRSVAGRVRGRATRDRAGRDKVMRRATRRAMAREAALADRPVMPAATRPVRARTPSAVATSRSGAAVRV